MIRVLYCLLVFVLAYVAQGHAQKRNNVWALGQFGGMDFNSGAGIPVKTNITWPIASGWSFLEGTASLCDTNGQLLFYGTGNKIWNKYGAVMQNAMNLVPFNTYSTTQGALIVPSLSNAQQYYYFSLQEGDGLTANDNNVCRLYYSIIDVSLNGGLGDVLPGKKGIPLDSNLAESMIAMKGDNGNIWLIVHVREAAIFKAYEITCNGINPTPVVSNAGKFTVNPLSYFVGMMAGAPNGKKIALCNTYSLVGGKNDDSTAGTEVYDFDPTTGIVFNAEIISKGADHYGVAFSPDNSKLYISSVPLIMPSRYRVIDQYDLGLSNPAQVRSSRTTVFKEKGPLAGQLRLAADGKIYTPSINNHNNVLDRIDFPNLKGAACQYLHDTVRLLKFTYTSLGLPAEVVEVPWRERGLSFVHDTTICGKEGFSVTISAPSGFNNYKWNNLGTQPSRTITKRGTYWVTSTDDCGWRIDTFNVHFEDIGFSLPADTIICDGSSMVLTAPELEGLTYLWSNGSTSNQISVETSGLWFLKVSSGHCSFSDTVSITISDLSNALKPNWGDTIIACKEDVFFLNVSAPAMSKILWSNGDENFRIEVNNPGFYWATIHYQGCFASDTVLVERPFCNCMLTIPSAFTPNGDGLNDRFRVIVPADCAIDQFEMGVYNRWGQLVFYTQNPKSAWDGTFKGGPAEAGIYMYTIGYYAGDKRVKKMHTGDIALIR